MLIIEHYHKMSSPQCTKLLAGACMEDSGSPEQLHSCYLMHQVIM